MAIEDSTHTIVYIAVRYTQPKTRQFVVFMPVNCDSILKKKNYSDQDRFDFLLIFSPAHIRCSIFILLTTPGYTSTFPYLLTDIRCASLELIRENVFCEYLCDPPHCR